MTGLKSTIVVLAVMMIASFQLQPTMAKTRHIVGDALGWTIPPNGATTYATWASRQSFTVGDTLFFNFTTGFHTVAEVSQSATADPCTSTNTLSLNPTGPATITLTRPGTHYYICTIIGHCQIGQKLTIKVSPSTATAPESTALSPSSTIATPPSAYNLSPAGSPIPLPWSASPLAFAPVVPVTLLAVTLAFFY
ncbi:putative Phytocyanin domain, cupredoxin [Helianthus annuus]|nr:putative Phytocyanin domain, cupredoxin [Helianthus annuus]